MTRATQVDHHSGRPLDALGLHRGRLMLVSAAVLLAVVSADDDGPALCPYRRCTGGDCPLCGVTRSAGRLVRGDLAGSWRIHPYVIMVAVQLPLVAFGIGRGDRARVQTLAVVNLVAALALWVVRLAIGDAAPPHTLQLPW